MDKTILIILALVFLLQSCIDKRKKDVLLFESALSKENIRDLNQLVNEFDNFLLEKFPTGNSLDSSYNIFLTKVCLGESVFDRKSDSLFFLKIQNQYKNSELEKEIELHPDSLILTGENKSLVRVYKYKDKEKGIIEVIRDTFLLPPNPQKINLEKIDLYKFLDRNNRLKLFNVFGEYYKGLEKIENKNEFIKLYLEYTGGVLYSEGSEEREVTSGFMPFNLLACGLINNNVDLIDYFTKRIIIVELLN